MCDVVLGTCLNPQKPYRRIPRSSVPSIDIMQNDMQSIFSSSEWHRRSNRQTALITTHYHLNRHGTFRPSAIVIGTINGAYVARIRLPHTKTNTHAHLRKSAGSQEFPPTSLQATQCDHHEANEFTISNRFRTCTSARNLPEHDCFVCICVDVGGFVQVLVVHIFHFAAAQTMIFIWHPCKGAAVSMRFGRLVRRKNVYREHPLLVAAHILSVSSTFTVAASIISLNQMYTWRSIFIHIHRIQLSTNGEHLLI